MHGVFQRAVAFNCASIKFGDIEAANKLSELMQHRQRDPDIKSVVWVKLQNPSSPTFPIMQLSSIAEKTLPAW